MDLVAQSKELLDPAAWSSLAFSSVRVVIIALLAWLVYSIGSRLIRNFRKRLASRMTDPEQQRRAETLGRVIRYVLSVVVTLVAGMLMLAEFGVSVAPILGAAGVVGLAVGFGAQTLVKDYFTGFFLLLENQIATGDVVEIAGKPIRPHQRDTVRIGPAVADLGVDEIGEFEHAQPVGQR